MKAYLARDKDGILHRYDEKPEKGFYTWISYYGVYSVKEPDERYAYIKWEDDEPTEVTLEIKL